MQLSNFHIQGGHDSDRYALCAEDSTYRYHIWVDTAYEPLDFKVYKNHKHERRHTIILNRAKGLGMKVAVFLISQRNRERIAAHQEALKNAREQAALDHKAAVLHNRQKEAAPEMFAALKYLDKENFLAAIERDATRILPHPLGTDVLTQIAGIRMLLKGIEQ